MYMTRQGKGLSLDDIPNCSLSDQNTLALLADDDIDLEYLSAALEESPTITAAIIGLANSAYFASPVQVLTVRDAIIKVLGVQTVKSLALSIILGASFDLSRCPAFSPSLYWSHALATACCSEKLVRSARQLDADQAYLCGLLADFGQLVLAHLFPDEVSALCVRDNRQLSDLMADQQQHTGTDQGIAGSLLATRWRLPLQVKTVIRHHHDPAYRAEYWQLTKVIGFVAQLMRNLQYQTEPIGTLQLDLTGTATDQLAGLLDVTEAELALLLTELPSIYESVCSIAEHFSANATH
jgi:HD-like signal output (HDOD) protein|tara:strand:+ start:861 stop:1745 length:885 start_codon:yes stop_codon:yes gene_type:complete